MKALAILSIVGATLGTFAALGHLIPNPIVEGYQSLGYMIQIFLLFGPIIIVDVMYLNNKTIYKWLAIYIIVAAAISIVLVEMYWINDGNLEGIINGGLISLFIIAPAIVLAASCLKKQ